MSLTKEQITKLRRNQIFFRSEEYSESDLREAVGITKKIKGMGEYSISWLQVTDYVFYWFNKFDVGFKREVKESFIKEAMKSYRTDRKEAIKIVNEYICSSIVDHIMDHFKTEDETKVYTILKEIKEGKFNEFIEVDDVIPFS